MFNSLTGTITGKFPQKVFIETHGIEWDVTIPDTSLDALPPVGQEGRVYTYLQHTDAAMTLFGFASDSDRALFFDLLKVDGVGPKSAVKIMSSIAREQLVSALDSGNLAALEKIPGLGKKTAQKMLLQLKGKLTLDDDASLSVAKISRSGEFSDVVAALCDMGYEKRNVEETVARLSEGFKASGDFEGKTKEAKEELIFRRAIVELAQ